MRDSAHAFHQTVRKHFGAATFNGKRWLTMYEDRGLLDWLLMFGPEMTSVVPALVTYSASMAKNVIVPEVDDAFEAFLSDIAATGHTMAADGIRLWTEAGSIKLRDEDVDNASVFPPAWTVDQTRQVIARLKERLKENV